MNKAPLTLEVRHAGFWSGFDVAVWERMFPFTRRLWRLALSGEPGLVLGSVFGQEGYAANARRVARAAQRRWPGAVRLFFTGENVPPPMEDYDYCVSFRRNVQDRRHLRWPLFLPHLHAHGWPTEALLTGRGPHASSARRPRFCAFIARNPGHAVRAAFVRRLSEYKRVDCPGAVLNNMPNAVRGKGGVGGARGKIEFLSSYKFAVCFENESTMGSEGYVTEKLVDAMLAGCVPLYWGDRRVAEDFNPRSFVDLAEFGGDLDAMTRRVAELDQRGDLYQRVAAEPWFVGDRVPPQFANETAAQFFRRAYAAAGQPRGAGG